MTTAEDLFAEAYGNRRATKSAAQRLVKLAGLSGTASAQRVEVFLEFSHSVAAAIWARSLDGKVAAKWPKMRGKVWLPWSRVSMLRRRACMQELCVDITCKASIALSEDLGLDWRFTISLIENLGNIGESPPAISVDTIVQRLAHRLSTTLTSPSSHLVTRRFLSSVSAFLRAIHTLHSLREQKDGVPSTLFGACAANAVSALWILGGNALAMYTLLCRCTGPSHGMRK